MGLKGKQYFSEQGILIIGEKLGQIFKGQEHRRNLGMTNNVDVCVCVCVCVCGGGGGWELVLKKKKIGKLGWNRAEKALKYHVKI